MKSERILHYLSHPFFIFMVNIHTPQVVINLTCDLSEVISKLNSIISKQNSLMADLTQLTQDVQSNATVIGSAITLLQGLKEKLDAAGTDATKLAELSASLEAQTNSLASAVAANTPASDTPPTA